MKITIERAKPGKIIKVVKASYLSDFVLRVAFSDGKDKVVDFKQFLRNASHPSIQKYFKESDFKKFKLVDGNINWNDYEMIFPIEQLYKGQIN